MSNWRRSWIWGPVTMLWGGFTVALASISVPLVAVFTGRSRARLVVARAWSDQMLWVCDIRFQRAGWETLPEEIRSGRQPVVFMCNHESHFDPPVAIGWLDIPAVFGRGRRSAHARSYAEHVPARPAKAGISIIQG